MDYYGITVAGVIIISLIVSVVISTDYRGFLHPPMVGLKVGLTR